MVVVARNLPEGGEFNIEDLTFSWTPGLEDAGVYQFYVVAIDQEEAKGHQRVTLVVENTNQPPRLILDEEAIEAKEGEILSFTVGTIDDDGDQVGVEAQNLPEGAEFFDPVFLWEEPVEGEYTITFVATDNPYNLTDTREVTITVIGVNDPPVFDLVPDVSVETGEPVVIELSATDPDDDVLTLTYSLIVTGEDNILSREAAFVGNTFNWTPAATDIGPNIVTFMVEDPEDLKDFLEAAGTR